jgi:hypothetical protein
MTASATSHVSSGSANETRSRDQPSPLVLALDRLFPKKGHASYATLERLVALVIVRAMSFDGDTGDWNCFLSYPTIARWSGTSVASVKRMLQKHGDGPAPLFFRTRSGQTRGRPHQCYRFTWVWHPEQFAAARDAARQERTKAVARALSDLQPERLALQRQLLEFGGTLTHAEYRRRLVTLESATRRKVTARAFAK